MEDVVAFDTGPGNMLIDGLVRSLTNGARRRSTADGAWAAAGELIPGMADHLLEDPYLSTPPPKSTGREYYGGQVRDLMAQVGVEPGALDGGRCGSPGIPRRRRFTARSIGDAYRRWLPGQPDEVLVNGGGSRNPV